MYCFDFYFIEMVSWDSAGGPVVKNLPSNAGSESSIPGGRTKTPHVTEQLNWSHPAVCITPQLWLLYSMLYTQDPFVCFLWVSRWLRW